MYTFLFLVNKGSLCFGLFGEQNKHFEDATVGFGEFGWHTFHYFLTFHVLINSYKTILGRLINNKINRQF